MPRSGTGYFPTMYPIPNETISEHAPGQAPPTNQRAGKQKRIEFPHEILPPRVEQGRALPQARTLCLSDGYAMIHVETKCGHLCPGYRALE